MADPNTILAVASFTGSVLVAMLTLGWWLSGRFRLLERFIVVELAKHAEEDTRRFGGIYDRLKTVENWQTFRERTHGKSVR